MKNRGMNEKKLIKEAILARKYSFSPYSGFKVGSAVLTSNNNIFRGTNIECSSFSLTICAERVAIIKAISEGEKKIKTIAISTDTEDFKFPCGACLQFIADFSINPDIFIINSEGKFIKYKLKDLLPKKFSLKIK